jgi:predicted signal transduction protein with EAL and GGDEF domain
MNSPLKHFVDLRDPRVERTREHLLEEILLIAFAANLQLAHSFRLEVIAEGVETEEQLSILRALGCGYLQGYLFSRPADADTAERLYRTTRAPGPSIPTSVPVDFGNPGG